MSAETVTIHLDGPTVEMKPHPTVYMVDTTLGLEADIDVLMVPLIRACWDAGISTVFCCQGDASDDDAYVSFYDEDFLAFIRATDKVLTERAAARGYLSTTAHTSLVHLSTGTRVHSCVRFPAALIEAFADAVRHWEKNA